MSKATDTFRPNPLLAAFLAWIVPGAGHLYLRKRARGLVILITIAVSFWGGVALGGAMTVSHEAEPLWFAADMVAGVHGLAAWQHQQRVYGEVLEAALRKAGDQGRPGDTLAARQELVRNEVDNELARRKLALTSPVESPARAFSGVAGLLNFLCIFDALMLAFMGRVGEPPRGGAEQRDADRGDADKKRSGTNPATFSREPKASAERGAGAASAERRADVGAGPAGGGTS